MEDKRGGAFKSAAPRGSDRITAPAVLLSLPEREGMPYMFFYWRKPQESNQSN